MHSSVVRGVDDCDDSLPEQPGPYHISYHVLWVVEVVMGEEDNDD